MAPPRYQNIEPEDVPEVTRGNGAVVRVIAGEFDGVGGAVAEIAVEPVFLDVKLPAGVAVELPALADYAGFIYPFEGSVEIPGEDGSEPVVVADSPLGALGEGDVLSVRGGPNGGRFILVAGQPIGEPIARYGPFVMNTRVEIVQAVDDFQSGKF
jgi:redox-sensitive bicupin YhaK (pirin superfamily)